MIEPLLSDAEVTILRNAILKEGGTSIDCDKAIEWAADTKARTAILSNLLEGHFRFALPVENEIDPKFSLTEKGKAYVESNFGRGKR